MKSKIYAYEISIADIEIALKHTKDALKQLQTAELLGKTAQVLNPYCDLLDSLKKAIEVLQNCKDEYSNMCEGAIEEVEKF